MKISNEFKDDTKTLSIKITPENETDEKEVKEFLIELFKNKKITKDTNIFVSESDKPPLWRKDNEDE